MFHKTLQRYEVGPGQHFLILLVHLRADRPSCYSLFSRALFSQSNPVDRPPAHQLHLHWRAIRQRHWHSRASVCAEADVYSTTQESGLMHYTGITLFIVFSAASGRDQCLFGEAKEWSEKFSWELGLCHSADPNVGTDCAHEHPGNFNSAKCRVSIQMNMPNNVILVGPSFTGWLDFSVEFLHEAKVSF